ncbi:MAG: UvrD-helicase domain-containing protein [Legionellales bacterium]|nr:UvrD-helicase domain-containing protein [Legionellales bacterium]
MNKDSKLIIAAAGSGKTTFLVNEALQNKDSSILITTYTQANEEGIRNKFIKLNGCIPKNITIQTWFSFLIQHGLKPFQGNFDESLYEYAVKGLLLTNTKSAVKYINKKGVPVCYKEDELLKHYFSPENKIYSDKLSKLVVGGGEKFRKNENRRKFVELSLNRLSKIYGYIYIDEIQDLAGYDLEILKLLFNTDITVLMVGDPRQVTYLTHNESKYKKYRNGKIVEFIKSECKKNFPVENIDEISLKYSHRNNFAICQFSSKLYPDYQAPEPCACKFCRSNDDTDHRGIYLVREDDINKYLCTYNPMQLRWDKTTQVNEDFSVHNFGVSKGLEFEHVLIYPTKPFVTWLRESKKLEFSSLAKFYVAITRAKYSVGIVWVDADELSDIPNWDGQ